MFINIALLFVKSLVFSRESRVWVLKLLWTCDDFGILGLKLYEYNCDSCVAQILARGL